MGVIKEGILIEAGSIIRTLTVHLVWAIIGPRNSWTN